MTKISIVIPCYNESNRLPPSLVKIAAYKKEHPELDIELVVVDDGSKDSTAEIMQKSDVIDKKVFVHPNGGKGAALRRGVQEATGEYIYLADADFSAPIEELPNFLKYVPEYDCVIGSRALAQSKIKTSFKRKMLGRIGNVFINLFLRLNLKDTQCGFKLLTPKTRELFLNTTINRWGYDFEFLYFLKGNHMKVMELPVVWVNSDESRVTASSYFRTLSELMSIWWKYSVVGKVPQLATHS